MRALPWPIADATRFGSGRVGLVKSSLLDVVLTPRSALAPKSVDALITTLTLKPYCFAACLLLLSDWPLAWHRISSLDDLVTRLRVTRADFGWPIECMLCSLNVL